MNFRSILNSGEVSVPVLPSPPLKEFTTNPFSGKAFHRHLVRERSVRRSAAKGRAGRFPIAVCVSPSKSAMITMSGEAACSRVEVKIRTRPAIVFMRWKGPR